MTENLKKIVIFGATGTTGLVTVKAAINAGYEVTVFVRDRAKLPSDSPVTKVVQGDVCNKDDVMKAVEGQHGVIIALGTRNDLSPTTVLSDGTKNILEAMKTCGIKRVSCCISSFLFWDKEKVPKPYVPVTEDHERMLEALKASDREWVAVLPPHIAVAVLPDYSRCIQKEGFSEVGNAICYDHTHISGRTDDEPAKGNYIIKNDVAVGRVISKYDLAEILVKCLCSDENVGHAVGIGYPQSELMS